MCLSHENLQFFNLLQVRHGAASGLREIMKVHGEGAGKTKDTLQSQVWLLFWENTIIHLRHQNCGICCSLVIITGLFIGR